MRTTYVFIYGGLGNQMFQAALGEAIRTRYNSTIRYINLTSDARVPRAWELGIFGLQPHAAGTRYSSLLWRLFKLGLKVQRLLSPRSSLIYDEKNVAHTGLPTRAPLFINGYFQSERFFLDTSPADTFCFPAHPYGLDIQPNSVAIHVRRGDYVTDIVARRSHLICDETYYEQAWALMLRWVPDARAYVFSDDPEWAHSHLNLPGDVTYVENPDGKPAWVDLSLMAQCQHSILSNSSYSWWGAYLATNPAQRVIVPDRWTAAARTDDLDICPAYWYRLTTRPPTHG